MRDLGTAGENYFSAWCAAAGMTANKAVSDRNGWDIFVEIDKHSDNFDLDMVHEGLIETKIQVKATDGKKKWVDIELSNLKKMATTVLPSFYVLMEFDEGETPTNAYILHIDHSLIGKILKRISELVTADRNVKLNKKKMRLTFNECITPLSAEKLKKIILHHIGPSHLDYINAKRNYLNSAGIEDGAYQVKFSIKGDDQFHQLIDMSLGKKGRVEIINIHSTKTRFGIAVEQPSLKSDSALLELPNITPDANGLVTFRDKISGRSLTFPIDLYRGVFNSWIPKHLRKIRMDCELFEIHLSNLGKAINLTANIDLIETFEIDDVLKLFKLISMLGNPGNVRMTLTFPDLVTDAYLTPSKGFPDCSQQLTTLEEITKIKRYFELDGGLFLAPSEIEEQRRKINQIIYFIDGRTDVLKLKFKLDKEPQLGPNTDCFYVLYFELGEHSFMELVLFHGTLNKTTENNYAFKPEKKTTFYKTTLKTKEINKESLKDELLNSMANHDSSHCMIDLVPDFISKTLRLPSFSQID